MLEKTTNGHTTKYVWGLGLIGEQKCCDFKTYHFDLRGSTVAITDEDGEIIDTLKYDTYGKLTEHTGDSFVIFGYNDRDGVITDDNGLCYMRARYYSPDMRRFVNADIIPGKISNSVTLNRFVYANGNPVSFIDPFGLSAERQNTSETTPINFYQAVLVSRTTNGGLPLVGHTVLYLLGDNGIWYSTEFNTTSGASGIKDKKSNAKIWWEDGVDVSDFYDVSTGQYLDNPTGLNYVVLNGNFNESAALAQSYSENQNFGRYNFFFHNCADYTNKLLDVADIDGMMSQALGDGNALISIPSIREFGLSVASGIDSVINSISDGLIYAGNAISGSNLAGNIAGGILVGAGEFVDVSTDFIGDAADVVAGVIGGYVDIAKTTRAVVTNTIIDVGTAIKDGLVDAWNWLFG